MKRIKYISTATCAVLAVITMIVAIADLVTGISVWFFYAGFVLAGCIGIILFVGMDDISKMVRDRNSFYNQSLDDDE